MTDAEHYLVIFCLSIKIMWLLMKFCYKVALDRNIRVAGIDYTHSVLANNVD